ncbi:hypothetical protein CDCA_CDCA11G3296 [Cyanidium caldarium]|uniref:Uncharacterized protein n=1 Tax=Cyanidium caldarium TaxID=2771 RepID=A0AAV9IYQ8_CYACA|nr:hypothetical protein CDCA_CDCA11G3296 [Cyanidium caldarium]
MVGGIGGNGDPWTPQRVQAGDPVGTPARGWWRGGQAVLGGRADVPGSRWEAGAVSSPLPTVQQVSPVSDRFSSAEWKPRVVGKGVGSGRHKRPKWGREVAPDTGRSLVPSRANDASDDDDDDDDDDEEEEEEKEPASAAWLAALDMAAAAVAKTEPVTPKTPEVAEPTTPRQPVAEAETVSVDTALSDPVRSPVKVPPASEHLISIAEWPLRSIAAYRRWMQQQRPQWIETNTTRLPSAAALPLSTTASESLSDADVALSDTFDAEPGRRAAVYPNTPAGQQLESKHAAEMEALSQESRERLAQLMDAPERDIERITDTLRQQEHLLRHVRALHAFERRLLRDDPRFVVGAVRAGSEALVYAAVCECVLEGFPRVFDLSPEWRRSRKVRGVVHALTELVRFNPMANGMQARQDWVRRQRTAELLRGGRQPVAEASSPVIELPHTSSVTESYAEAVAACWRGLGDKCGHAEPPALSELAAQLAHVRNQHPCMYLWYEDLHHLVRRGCARRPLEMHLFLSLLATCSPNSSVAANTVNALLNYRAVSQGYRPRHGSYPFNSLLNYLAGCVGAPSGAKVTAFLDNLLRPSCSMRVTVDTHMQKVLLGNSGRLTLSAREYRLLERVLVAAARELGEAHPCRLQSCLWALQAGSITYSGEMRKYARRLQVRLESATVGAVSMPAAWHQRVCERLLDCGYLNELVATTVDPCLQVYVPIRRESVKSMRAHMAMRRTFARKQQRELMQREQAELAAFEAYIAAAEADGTAAASDAELEHFEDRAWFVADMQYVARVLLRDALALRLADVGHGEVAVGIRVWPATRSRDDDDHDMTSCAADVEVRAHVADAEVFGEAPPVPPDHYDWDPYFGAHRWFTDARRQYGMGSSDGGATT